MADSNEPSKGEGGGVPPAAPQAATAAATARKQPAPGMKSKPAAEAAAQGDTLPTGPLMTVLVRNEFYRDGFRNLIWVALGEAVGIVLLLLTFISYIETSQSQDHYFATTADGRIMQLVPLELPNMGTSALLSWAAQAGTEVMTFGFHDYQRRLQNSSRFFTRHGWETFATALQKSRIIESVDASQQVVSATPGSAPILTQEGVFNGRYRWYVDLPLKVTYQSGTNIRSDSLVVHLVLDRVPSLENPSGVGIEQWISANVTSDQ